MAYTGRLSRMGVPLGNGEIPQGSTADHGMRNTKSKEVHAAIGWMELGGGDRHPNLQINIVTSPVVEKSSP